MDRQVIVTYVSLVAGVVCLSIYVRAVWNPKITSASAVTDQAHAFLAGGVSIDQFNTLIGAIAKLTDSLTKAGPALTSLIGAIFFFAIAAIGSGVLHDPPKADASGASKPGVAAHQDPTSNTVSAANSGS